MLLPATSSTALLLMLVSMVCWGSWTNTSRLARGWPLASYYADYSAGVFAVALAAALGGGLLFGRPDFLDNMRAADAAAIACALAGGACLNAGNYLLMAGIERVGMTVAFPVSVGFALVVSTILSYLVNPRGRPGLLAAGVALVFCAVLVNAAAYRSLGSAKRAGRSRGLATCFAAGVLFSICGPLVAKALSTPRPLAPYGAAVLYAGGSLAASVPLLLAAGWRPAAWRRGSGRNHASGFSGGFIWGAGMVANFLAAGLSGMAVSGAIGQANPLVAAAWGIFVWHEFRGAGGRTHALLALMIGLYAGGLIVLAFSFR